MKLLHTSCNRIVGFYSYCLFYKSTGIVNKLPPTGLNLRQTLRQYSATTFSALEGFFRDNAFAPIPLGLLMPLDRFSEPPTFGYGVTPP